MRRLLAPIALLLALSGCWTGAPWFAASEVVNVIPDGRYHLLHRDEPEAGDKLRISRQPDGSLQLDGSGELFKAIVVALNPGTKDQR